MFLLVILACFDFGSSLSTVGMCYGRAYEVPIYYTPPLFNTAIYYKQRGGDRILAVSAEGKSQNTRFLVGVGRIILKELTEQDDGAMLYFGGDSIVKFEIEDCQDTVSMHYGSLLSWRIPEGAQYLEFSRILSSHEILKPQVIWNRTGASTGRGKVKRGFYELQNLKQKDSGYYKFMAQSMIEYKRVEVKEYNRQFERMEGQSVDMTFPVTNFKLSRIGFTPRGSDEEGEVYTNDPDVHITKSEVTISRLEYERTGTYTFIDEDGFVVLRVELEVILEPPTTFFYIVGAVAIVLFIVCCCCVKKCCCKKSKRSSPATEAAAPPTEAAAPPAFYHCSRQPSQPVVPLLSREPRASTADPPGYNAVVHNTDLPPSTQVTAPGGMRPTVGPMGSSDPDPKYEFKGTVFPSAPPLDSGTSIQDVYTSDKLNFL